MSSYQAPASTTKTTPFPRTQPPYQGTDMPSPQAPTPPTKTTLFLNTTLLGTFPQPQYALRATGDASLPQITAPVTFSDTAVRIIASKYARKAGVPDKRVCTNDAPTPNLSHHAPAPDASFGAETDMRDIFSRMAGFWARAAYDSGLMHEGAAQHFYEVAVRLLECQVLLPNSPQWFNCGLYHAYGIEGDGGATLYNAQTGSVRQTNKAYTMPQTSACFINRVDDQLVGTDSIMSLWDKEAMIFKFGSGSGADYSDIRGRGEALSGGGKSSGLMSFLHVGNAAAGAIKSGGVTRRAARMVVLRDDHPDVEEFVEWKVREEDKVAYLVAGSRAAKRVWNKAQHDPDGARRLAKSLGVPRAWTEQQIALLEQDVSYVPADMDTDWQGEAYATVSGQNSNNSLRVSDNFMRACHHPDGAHVLRNRVGRGMRTVAAWPLWEKITRSTWACADPGLQFDDTIQDWHTCPADGPIRASNPCSEYLFLDDTACNLASINLTKFYDTTTGKFDAQAFEQVVAVGMVILEASLTASGFPTPTMAVNCANYRTTGLGYMDLGALLMRMGHAYGSPQALAWTRAITSLMTLAAYRTSAMMANVLGAYPRFEANKAAHLRVLDNHVNCVRRDLRANADAEFVGLRTVPPRIPLYDAVDVDLRVQLVRLADEVSEFARMWGLRNAQVTVIAPTGTISLAADCSTSGMEPAYGLVVHKSLAGGGTLRMVNQEVHAALRACGVSPQACDRCAQRIADQGGFDPADPSWLAYMSPASLAQLSQVLLCATPTVPGGPALSAAAHVDMLAAAQPLISGGISKTVNLPHDASIKDIDEVFLHAWRLGVKCIAVYRDGSKLSQPLTTSEAEAEAEAEVYGDAPAATPDLKETRGAVRSRLPDRVEAVRDKLRLGGFDFYLHRGHDEHGVLREIFISASDEGSSLSGLLRTVAKLVSVTLQHGVPLTTVVGCLLGGTYAPSGMVQGSTDVRMAASVTDLIGRHLQALYLTPCNTSAQESAPTTAVPLATSRMSGEACSSCHSFSLRRAGTCLVCTQCGQTTGCS